LIPSEPAAGPMKPVRKSECVELNQVFSVDLFEIEFAAGFHNVIAIMRTASITADGDAGTEVKI
jgi:hypothetical protein